MAGKKGKPLTFADELMNAHLPISHTHAGRWWACWACI